MPISQVGLGFLNLMSAIFVDTLLSQTSKENDEKARLAKQAAVEALHLVEQLFRSIDVDGSGKLDEEELQQALAMIHERQWRSALVKLNLEPEDVETAMSELILDVDDDGTRTVSFEDFQCLFSSMEEPAKEISVTQVEKQVRMVNSRVDRIENNLNIALCKLDSIMSALSIDTNDTAHGSNRKRAPQSIAGSPIYKGVKPPPLSPGDVCDGMILSEDVLASIRHNLGSGGSDSEGSEAMKDASPLLTATAS